MPDQDIAVMKFREYLRVNTEQPSPDYDSCCKFLINLADELGIRSKVVEVRSNPGGILSEHTVPGKPFVIMTIPGLEPTLSSIVLYSHTDVVPTFKDNWKYDPYSAHKDEEGNIYGRGAQDMKCVGSQYFEAIRRHFLRGKKQWLRTIHIVWAPDEEIGGTEGMQKFVKMPEFRELNLGFMLDEGLASETSTYKVYYGERNPWWIEITCRGSPGHGSKFIEDTAAEKLQRSLLISDSSKTLGDVITVNITRVTGGVQVNVLPEHFILVVDMRLPPTADFSAMDATIYDWCENAGPGVTYRYVLKTEISSTTPTTNDDPFWFAFENSLKEEKCDFDKEIFSGSTDSRFVRELGYRSIGFSPMINTPSLLHDHNEYLNESVFLRGVEIYETLIDNLANVESA